MRNLWPHLPLNLSKYKNSKKFYLINSNSTMPYMYYPVVNDPALLAIATNVRQTGFKMFTMYSVLFQMILINTYFYPANVYKLLFCAAWTITRANRSFQPTWGTNKTTLYKKVKTKTTHYQKARKKWYPLPPFTDLLLYSQCLWFLALSWSSPLINRFRIITNQRFEY